MAIVKWLYPLNNYNCQLSYNLTFELCCRNNNINVAKWWHTSTLARNRGYTIDISTITSHTLAFSFKRGRRELAVAKWLYKLDPKHITKIGQEALNLRCQLHNDKIGAVKWLQSIGVNVRNDDDSAFKISCDNGNINIAKWLFSLEIPIKTITHLPPIHCENKRIAEWLHYIHPNKFYRKFCHNTF